MRTVKIGTLERTVDKDKVFDVIGRDIKAKAQTGARLFLVKAGTGLGKSTEFMYQLYTHFSGWRVICTQTTRYNAHTIAEYFSTKAGMALGTTVGIQTGSEHVAAKQYHAVVYATVASILNGIILPDSRMESRTVVVIDEAHANSLEMQVTLAAIRVAARRVPLSKLPVFVIQSASLDLPRMSRYFNTQHCYQVEGVQKPVLRVFSEDLGLQVRSIKKYVREVVSRLLGDAVPQVQAFKDSVPDFRPDGDILVFVTGEGMCKDVVAQLETLEGVPRIYALSRQSVSADPDVYDRINQPTRKIIVATNVAETGATFKHVSYVIDCMKFINVVYNPVTKAHTIATMAVCKSMSQQREGRVGRAAPGVYVPVIRRADYERLLDARESMLQIQDLKSVIGLIDYETFCALQLEIPPEMLLDVQQGLAFAGYAIATKHKLPLYKRLVLQLPKIGMEGRLFLYAAHVLGMTLAQAAIATGALLTVRSKEPALLKRGVNAIADAYSQAQAANWPGSEVVCELMQHFANCRMDAFAGPALSQAEEYIVLQRAFTYAHRQHICKLHAREADRALYRTRTGLLVVLKCESSTDVPAHIVSDRMYAESPTKAKPNLLVDCDLALRLMRDTRYL